jgi:hypothetical protein
MNINPLVSFKLLISPLIVRAGEPITLSGLAENKMWRRNTVYFFASTGGQISGTGRIVTLDTTRLAPGVYTVKAHCSQGDDLTDQMDASGTFSITGY